MFLNMRQEQVNLLREYRRMLRRQCRALPPEAGDALRKVLSGESSPEPDAADLCRQVASNRQLLERTLQADRALSVRLGGEQSFYRRPAAERTTE